jgi:uncharacterized protein (TIGR00369 family)
VTDSETVSYLEVGHHSPADDQVGLRLDGPGPDDTWLRARFPLDAEGRPDTGPVGTTLLLNVVADAACGFAMSRAQEVGLSGPTVQLRVDHLRDPGPGDGPISGRAAVRRLVHGTGYVQAAVLDGRSRELVNAQGHFLALPPGTRPEQPLPRWDGAYTPLVELLAAAAVPDEPDGFVVPTGHALANPRNQVHGGVLMTVGELAQRHTQSHRVTDPAALRPLSVTAEYLRPAPVDGSALTCRTSYLRHGRRYRTLRTDIVRADQKVAASVTGLWSVVD